MVSLPAVPTPAAQAPMAGSTALWAFARALAALRARVAPAVEPAVEPAAASQPSPGNDRSLLLYERLDRAGVDAAYLAVTDAAGLLRLESVCRGCGYVGRCARDLNADDRDAVASYCPNTPAIDDAILRR